MVTRFVGIVLKKSFIYYFIGIHCQVGRTRAPCRRNLIIMLKLKFNFLDKKKKRIWNMQIIDGTVHRLMNIFLRHEIFFFKKRKKPFWAI